MTENNEMLDFVKALAHADRLKIVGMLTRKPSKRAEIAAALSLPEREASRHLAFLEHARVVQSTDGLYELNTNGLDTLFRRQFGGKHPTFQANPELGQRSQKVLATFLNADGTIRQVPNSRTQSAKFQIVLEYILAAFETGVTYTEKEVNMILHRFNEDVAGLRRDLVDAKMLARERDGSKYWLPSANEGNARGRSG